MTTLIDTLIFRHKSSPLSEQAVNFLHLYHDVAWYGLTVGSTLFFLAIFATRLGAAGWQIALLSAGPALINACLTLPAGRWLETQPLGQAVLKTSIGYRLGFLLLAPLPLVLPGTWQLRATLLLILLMAIPGTALTIGFNALLATTVPPEARGRVVGRRNALLAGSTMTSFLLCGWLLNQLPFAWGYAAVFGLGALGSGLSSYHLAQIKVPPPPKFLVRPLGDMAQPGRSGIFSGDIPNRLHIGLRLWLRWYPSKKEGLTQISSRYRQAMGAFFFCHFAILMPAALFPMFWVHEAGLNDGQISWINASLYLTMLVAAPWLEPLTRKLGNLRLSAMGAALLSSIPLLTVLSSGLPLLIIANLFGGLVWAILSGALGNRLLELTPDDQRPAHLAIYNLALNGATLLGAMSGPLLANWLGLREALWIVVILRVLSGVIIARWG